MVEQAKKIVVTLKSDQPAPAKLDKDQVVTKDKRMEDKVA